MSHDPPLDLASYLDAHSTAFTLNTNLFVGPVRAHTTDRSIPVQAAFVNQYGGPPPSRVLGTATELRQPKVSIIVRSSGYVTGAALARTVFNTLQSATPTTGNAYMDVRALQPEPTFLEQDKNMHLFWSLSFELLYQST